jgi:urease accessory protein
MLAAPAPAPRSVVHGRAEIGWSSRDGATRLSHLFHHDPLRVLFPRVTKGELPTAALVTTSGGLVGGDRIDVEVSVGPGARALVTTPSAEKVYRSTGASCALRTALSAGEGGLLEWCPQETILFDRSRLERTTTVELAAGATLLAGEVLVFGRLARGERLTSGLVRDGWEVRRAGRLLWADALLLDGDLQALLSRRAAFDGAVSCATFLCVAPDPAPLAGIARPLLGHPGVRAAATVVNGVLVVRWLSGDAAALRRSYATFRAGFREALGLGGRLPAVWQ